MKKSVKPTRPRIQAPEIVRLRVSSRETIDELRSLFKSVVDDEFAAEGQRYDGLKFVAKVRPLIQKRIEAMTVNKSFRFPSVEEARNFARLERHRRYLRFLDLYEQLFR